MSQDKERAPSSPDASDPPPKLGRELGKLLALAAVVALVAVGLYLNAQTGSGSRSIATDGSAATGEGSGSAHAGLPDVADEAMAMDVAEAEVQPALLVDVHGAARLRQALAGSGWLKRFVASPLGQGFAGDWLAFLGSPGHELGGAFGGTLLDQLSEHLLADRFRLVFFAGAQSSRTPVFVVEQPGEQALRVFATLTSTTGRGRYAVSRCPKSLRSAEGEQVAPSSDKKDKAAAPLMIVERWLVADRALFATRFEKRIVIANRPRAVVDGACVALPAARRDPKAVVEVQALVNTLGRGPQTLLALLGLGESPRLLLDVEQGALVPRGLRARDLVEGRLVNKASSEALLKLVPASTEVVAQLNLKLPAKLGGESLATLMAGEPLGDTTPRQILLLWTPHGTRREPTEVAVIWAGPDSMQDLQKLFAGGNAMQPVELCGHKVLASTKRLREAMAASCAGQAPSMLDAAPALKQGLLASKSLGVTVQLGALLWRLTEDAYRAEQASKGSGKKPLPKVMQQASDLLRELGSFGFFGSVAGDKLQPGGFAS